MARPWTGRHWPTALPIVLAMAAGPASAQDRAGERAFQKCFSCHSVNPEERDLPGPNLAGVVGRRAGRLDGFEYSPAMLAAGGERGLVWGPETLDRYLADPEAMVPGTLMSIPGLKDPGERAA